MIRLCVSLFSLSLAAAAEAPRIIPFEFYGNAIWLTARVNGSAPLHFLLDTAAGGTVLNRSRIGDLNLPVLSEHEQASAGSGDNPTRIALIPSVRIEFGGAALQPSRMVAIPLDEVANSYGAAIDGILGYELMDRYVVRIDFDRQTLTLFDPAEFRWNGQGAELPLEVRNRVPVVRVQVSLPGVAGLEGEFLVDEPYPGAVQFTTPFILKHDLLEAAQRLAPRMPLGDAVGVGGKFELRTGRLDSIQLGPYLLNRPIADFPSARAGAFARTDIAGIIGGELLRRFRVTLDYSRRRLILEPTPYLKDPFESDASGLGVKALGPPYREFSIRRVNEATPGAEAGIRLEDRILELDGKPVAELTLWQIRQSLRRPGQQYALKVRRGAETLRVILKTRRLL